MSLSKHRETKLEAEKFEKALDAENAHLDDLMKSPKKMTVMTMKTATTEKTVDMEMELIKKSGLLLLKFNGLNKEFKINLFDKLMKYIEKFKNLLYEYGNKMGVESFSIDVGVPLGVSISFTFKPKSP
jgi:uncharacterized protein (DUF927 family)